MSTTAVAAPDGGSNVDMVVAAMGGMSASELQELKTALYDKFGVKDHPKLPEGWDSGGAGAAAEVEEEQTEFTPTLVEAGPGKLNVIKVVREITGLGLKEAKELVDNAPRAIKEAVSREEAERIQSLVAEHGGKVDIK